MKKGSADRTGNIVYFSHGGGPLPILGEPSHATMVDFMKQLPRNIDKPDAILVVSAHWEEDTPTLIGHGSPSLFFDYYGFPQAAYELTYPVAGAPELARHAAVLLTKAGLSARIDQKRGFDHGLFIPLKMMYPEADIPVTQLSLIKGLRPEAHMLMGKALQDLLEDNILVIGSGFSFHNMRAFQFDNTASPDPENDAFQEWLADVCVGNHGQAERDKMLLNWEKAPNARYCHPREEHLLPLHVCMGMAEGTAELIFDDYILGKRAIGLKWQG